MMWQVWKTLFELGESEKGRGEVTEAMRVCPDLLESPNDVAALADWASSAWDYMASPSRLSTLTWHCSSLLLIAGARFPDVDVVHAWPDFKIKLVSTNIART